MELTNNAPPKTTLAENQSGNTLRSECWRLIEKPGNRKMEGMKHQSLFDTDPIGEPGNLAADLTSWLQGHWPTAALHACLVCIDEGRSIHVSSDAKGEFLEEVLTRQLETKEVQLVPLSEGSLAGQVLVVGTIRSHRHTFGALAVALHDDQAAKDAENLLAMCGYSLGLRLELERVDKEVDECVRVNSLAIPVAHEINNFLNLVVLQLAALELEIPEQFRGELRHIRQLGRSMGGLVLQWQQYRQTGSGKVEPIDLNKIIKETIDCLFHAVASKALQIETTLSPKIPPIQGALVHVKPLVHLLMYHAIGAAATNGRIQVRTELCGEEVHLKIRDDGPGLGEEALARFFEAYVPARAGTNQLELLACQSLVSRRLSGSIEVHSPDGDGVEILVRLV